MTASTTSDFEATLDRDASLRDRVAGLAAGRGSIDRWMLVAGPFLLPLGFFVMWLAWYGASNTSRVYLQIPYMISGGLMGLGLVFAGGFLFFARFVVDLVRQADRHAEEARAAADRTVAALERIELLLLADAGPSSPRGSRPKADARPTSGSLVRTPKGGMAHRAECAMVAGRHVVPVDDTDELSACGVCDPDLG